MPNKRKNNRLNIMHWFLNFIELVVPRHGKKTND